MSDSSKIRTPEMLYREYQNTRDDIPSGVFSQIRSKVRENSHEDNIHSLLQEAKIIINSAAIEPESKEEAKESFFARIKNRFVHAPVKTWSTAVASVALAVIVMPFAINSPAPNYDGIAHLGGCSECATYIANASVITRGATPIGSAPNRQAKTAAKLGRLESNIKIAGLIDNEVILNKAIEELKVINAGMSNDAIETALESRPIKIAELSKAISTTQESIDYQATFLAAQSLHIANVTARLAIAEENSEHIAATLGDAISAYSNIPEKTVLQENLLQKLEQSQQDFKSDKQVKLERMIDLYAQAMASLGA